MAEILIAGAGGFIGGALAAQLQQEGHTLRCVDRKPLDDWYQVLPGAENVVADLQELDACRAAVEGVDTVYDLAADMGGMGFIEANKALCMLSVLTGTHMLLAAKDEGVGRFFFSSSACVYAADKQTDPAVTALREEDAYPAMAEDGYGWEKAPAALARKIALAALTGEKVIEIWGDGEQTRSFMYIDDCVRGSRMIAEGPYYSPVNLGSSELVSINQMVSILEEIAGVTVERRHDLTAPQGVRGRNSDNTLIVERYGWEPSVSLRDELEQTYRWIYDQLAKRQPVGV